MPPRAQRRAAAAAPLRLRAPPPRSAGLKPRPSSPLGLAPGVPRAGRADWPLGLHSRPPYRPLTYSRPGGAAATWGVARGWHWDRTPSRPGCVGPAYPWCRRLGARQVPHSTRTEFPPVSCPGGQEAAAGIAGSGRRSGSEKQLSPALLPPQCRCRRAGIPAGLGGCEPEAARVPARFRRGCSPRPPCLPRLQPAQSSPLRASPARLVFPLLLLDPASQLRRPTRPRERVGCGWSRTGPGFPPCAGSPSSGLRGPALPDFPPAKGRPHHLPEDLPAWALEHECSSSTVCLSTVPLASLDLFGDWTWDSSPPGCVWIPAFPGWTSLLSSLGHSQAASPGYGSPPVRAAPPGTGAAIPVCPRLPGPRPGPQPCWNTSVMDDSSASAPILQSSDGSPPLTVFSLH
ncbi:translation initiation factor IF-2-like [Felis catus]|uniref:translation initiation factor IF-2-like n=1 Tax=Felis catus TaxID=9685 RepID=UPI001D19C951|nr:translation initiation factor IF-2-like [Felis catus]